MIKKIDLKNYPISGNLNIAIFFGASLVSLSCLYFTQYFWMTWKMAPFILLFAYINNTLFSLLHEAVHGVFHPSKKINHFFGNLTAVFFPTSYSLQQIYHLGHHRRNRTDDEMFDLYYEGDNIFLKKLTIFGIMNGPYWLSAPLSCLIFFLFPTYFTSKSFINSRFNKSFKFDAMIAGAKRTGVPLRRIWLEILFAIVFWAVIFWILHLSFWAWILCYWAFGINWGSLQYTDHAFSKRDIRNGAWNLKVNPITRYFFLNYHSHLVHHRYPNLPWIHLPKLVDKSEGTPSFFEIYFRLWRGPEKATTPSPTLDREFEDLILEGTPYSET